jgi:AcrR family transcriptional regulator
MKDTRKKLLQAADKHILSRGVSTLTLDIVAEKARVSKGGLLYHFPSKMSLFEALVEESSILYEATMAKEITKHNSAPGRTVRAYIKSAVSSSNRELISQSSAIRIVAEHPELNRLYDKHEARLKEYLSDDGGDFHEQWLLISAFDGLWISEAFGSSKHSTKDWKKYLKILDRHIDNLEQKK